jgi:putative restriction endonuclease
MLWLEMSRDITHGGGSWSFTRSLWSPTRKRSPDGNARSRWSFWETVRMVQAGDPVLHLRGMDEDAAFVGFSTAATDGFETPERPPDPGEWDYAATFYRVLLKDYVAFPQALRLNDTFRQHDTALRDYFRKNSGQPAHLKRRLFYVIQSGRLQCLNGGYLSEVDNELAAILLGPGYHQENGIAHSPAPSVVTGESLQLLRARVGQKEFSDRVRVNYDGHCCFPGCPIAEREFLVGAHIARWADAPHLRGEVSNGLCLCLMHDRAFEGGFFTLSPEFRVVINDRDGKAQASGWCVTHILPFDGQPITLGPVYPSVEALRHHWERLGYVELAALTS